MPESQQMQIQVTISVFNYCVLSKLIDAPQSTRINLPKVKKTQEKKTVIER